MPEADRRTASVPLPAPNAAQRAAVEETVAIYEANPEVEFLEWRVIDPVGLLGRAGLNGLYIQFTYRDCLSGADRLPGCEVAVFAADGSVLDAHEFG